MFCIACGTPARDDARFCGKCGAKLFVPPPSEDIEASPQVVPPPPDAPAQEVTDPPPPMPTGAPMPMATSTLAQPAAVPMSPTVFLAGGGVGVLLGIGLIVGGFWKAPWQVVPGFLCCVVGVSVMLWRFSRVMAVLGGLLLAVLITFVASLPFGGIGQVFSATWWRFGYVKSVPPGTAFDTAALPEPPLGYQYLKAAGEEIDMVPYVVPEKTGTTTRRFDVFPMGGGRDTADIVIDAEGAPPTRWKTSGVVITSSERVPLPVGRIIVLENWLVSSEGSGNILFDAVPRRFQQGHLVPVLQSSVASTFERIGFDVRRVRVGIVARGEEKIAGKIDSVVLMWLLEGKTRDSGERKTIYALVEYANNAGVLKAWVCMARDQGWMPALSRDDLWAGQKTETGKPDVAPQPTLGSEVKPVEPERTPPPVAEIDTEMMNAPAPPSGVPPVLPPPVPVSSSAKSEVKESGAPAKKSSDDRTALKWVLIPAGAFTMGCTPGDAACQADETPAHLVTLTRSFQMSATETTNAQYLACVKAGACSPLMDRTALDDKSKGNHPVVSVSWGDAVKFCRWAGGRLPTEAEWEYAARGGYEGYQYPRGKVLSARDANYGGSAQAGDVWTDSSPVGSFPANGFDLYDMAGNVWEWCADRYDEHYYGVSPSQNPEGPVSGASRVVRGGCWALRPEFLRVSYRAGKDPTSASSDIGFRCVREANAP